MEPVATRPPKDTGFPEPFCKRRNTTLPHPDAKFGEDAVLGDEHHPAFMMRRRFAINHKHKHTINWGDINPDDQETIAAAKRPGRPNRADSLLPFGLTLESRPSRMVSFAIAEGDEEDGDGPAGMRNADKKEPGPLTVEDRRRDGHHRIGSVDSTMSTDSEASCPTPGSGDECSDPARVPTKTKRRAKIFMLLTRRSTSHDSEL